MRENNEFPTTVGVEWTYIIDPAKKYIDDFKVTEDFGKMKATGASLWINRKWYKDDGVIEIPSPITKNLATLKGYYTELENYTKQFPIVNWHETESLGGGHVHLGVKGLGLSKEIKERFIRNIYTEITNHPELNWALNCPLDNYNANSLLCKTTIRKLYDYPITNFSNRLGFQFYYGNELIKLVKYHKKQRNELINLAKAKGITSLTEHTPVICTQYDDYYFGNPLNNTLKYYSVLYRPKLQTIEFRLFDSPRDWTEQVLFLDIAIAIFNKCLNDTKNGITYKYSTMTLKNIRNMTLETSWKKFKTYLSKLGIDASRAYNQYSNMKVRFSYGKNYLI